MRGEHFRYLSRLSYLLGSSPHARGTPWAVLVCVLARGIIPACAGNTSVNSLVMPLTRDHPRMRGEHWDASKTTSSAMGSSPHARGTHLQSVAISRDIWIRHHLFLSLLFSALFAKCLYQPLPYNEFNSGFPSQSAKIPDYVR